MAKTGKKSNGWKIALGLGIIGGVIVALSRQRQPVAKKMPYLQIWQKQQTGQRLPEQVKRVASETTANYNRLVSQLPKPSHPALQFHQNQNILPALALYQTLLKEGTSQERAIAELEQVYRAAMKPLLKFYAWQKFLPDAFEFMRKTTPTGLHYIFPEVGFKTEWVANSENKLAVNIHGCFYLEIFKAQGAPELTALFCKLDDIMFEQLPSSIRWERTKTLGRGHEVCNFQWSKVDVSGKKPLTVIQN